MESGVSGQTVVGFDTGKLSPETFWGSNPYSAPAVRRPTNMEADELDPSINEIERRARTLKHMKAIIEGLEGHEDTVEVSVHNPGNTHDITITVTVEEPTPQLEDLAKVGCMGMRSDDIVYLSEKDQYRLVKEHRWDR